VETEGQAFNWKKTADCIVTSNRIQKEQRLHCKKDKNIFETIALNKPFPQ
jgi:hypothetical protein